MLEFAPLGDLSRRTERASAMAPGNWPCYTGSVMFDVFVLLFGGPRGVPHQQSEVHPAIAIAMPEAAA